MPSNQPTAFDVRTVPVTATRPLRLSVLRPGRPAGEAEYPGDDDPSTVHFGAFVVGEEEAAAAIASLYREARPGGPWPAWRLRGMATDARWRGLGLGRALVEACASHVSHRGGGELWCNARVAATGFYARAGFGAVSAEFDVPGIGPHVVMVRRVEAVNDRGGSSLRPWTTGS
ncbi:MAG: GNAT family N-acetyltransferase [Actinomycetota bacterium]